MTVDIFENRKKHSSGGKHVPVWFMRQAGRYHQHYQALKAENNFMSLCKTPALACEVTLGPIQDFKFDAAILFSDLLFPLEQLGLGLDYDAGPPRLHHHLLNTDDLKKLKVIDHAQSFYQFQADALKLLRQKLPKDVSLLGFVGSPWTLYTYAAEGSHSGNLISAKNGLWDGRWQHFKDILMPQLLENMVIQAKAGANAVCVFDTAAGELSPFDYEDKIAPTLNILFKQFKQQCPNTKLVYYSKWTSVQYAQCLDLTQVDVLGFDWRVDLANAASILPKHLFLQGNIDPTWLHLPWLVLKDRLDRYFAYLVKHNMPLDRWIAGLGHGVIIKTPEENVRHVVNYIHEKWHS